MSYFKSYKDITCALSCLAYLVFIAFARIPPRLSTYKPLDYVPKDWKACFKRLTSLGCRELDSSWQ